MLLLVLILVVIAFALLVVALLTGLVLWAWVSVGISVGAALVLLIDWLQRRSAVSAGADPPATDADKQVRPAASVADLDPVTEVIPVQRPDPAPMAETVNGVAPHGVPVEDEATRFDPGSAAQQTVAIRAFQPSGSLGQPSGAPPDVTPSSDSSSQTVVESTDAASSQLPPRTPSDVTVATLFEPGGHSPEAEPTAVVDAPEASGSAHVVEPAGAPEAEGVEPVAVIAAEDQAPLPDPDRTVLVDTRKGAGSGPADAPVVDAGSGGAADADPEPVEPPGAVGAGPVVAAETVVVDRPTSAGTAQDAAAATALVDTRATGGGAPAHPDEPAHSDETVVVDTRGGAAPVGSGETVVVDTRGGAPSAPADETVAVDTRAWGGGPTGADATVVVPTGGPPSDYVAAAQQPAFPPPGADGNPPEEIRHVDAATMVAGLEDEVLVVDEQPRYHVAGCRVLAASPVIPLPAREAVELGFTPCGWCAPDRTLVSRHHTAAR